MVKQEIGEGEEGRMVCNQKYRGRDGDEHLSEDAIRVLSEGEGGGGVWENAALQMPKW